MPLPEVADKQPGEIADTNKAYDLIDSLNVNVIDPDFMGGARGDDTTDDRAAIQAAIDACPIGGTVFFPPGKYVVAAPLTLRDNITLQGTLGNRWQAYTGTPCYIKPKFGGFVGTTGLLVATEVDGWRIRDLGLHSGRATGTGAAALNGLHVVGACKGVRLQNVWINNHSGYGVFTDTTANGFPGGWEIANLDLENNALGGWRSVNTGGASFAFGDGRMAFSEATANGGTGFYFAGLVAFDLFGVVSVFNVGAAEGIYLDGPSGTVGFHGCQTDRNIRNGLRLHCVDSTPTAQPAPHGITINGCNFSRDGKNDNTTQGGYSAIRIEGDSSSVRHCPVTINGITTHVIKDDAGTGLLSPDYAIYATNARRVLVNGCILVATVATVFDDLGAVILGTANSHNLVNVGTGAVSYDTAPVSPEWRPTDQGLKAWSYDPVICQSTGLGAATSGTLYFQRVHLPAPAQVTNVVLHVATAGATLTAGQSFAALYKADGTLVAATADQSTAWASTGLKTIALSGGPYQLPPGDYYVAYWSVGTTPPAFARGNNPAVSLVNVGLSAPALRQGTANTGLTTTAPTPMGTQTAGASSGWAGLS